MRLAAEEDDDDKELQAAIHLSVQAPSSPHPPSGAQSSEPKGAIDLDQQESELLTQLDHLMEESLRLETLPNPTFRDQSRVRSITTVAKDIELKLNEIATQKEKQAASSKVRRTQERSVPAATASATSVPLKAKTPVELKASVKSVVPSTPQPLTVESLIAGITQPGVQPPPAVDSRKAQPQPPTPVTMPIAPSLSAVPFPPLLMGKTLGHSSPPPKEGSLQGTSKEPSRERERTPPKEPSREKEKTSDSSRLRSKESRKTEKQRKKESRRRRRSESDEPENRSRRDERSRSSKGPDPPVEQPLEATQTETSAAEDPTPKGGSQLALTDKPMRARPKFDPSVEHVVGRKIVELTHHQPRQESRDSSTEGRPAQEVGQERRRPPPPRPATPPPSRHSAVRTRTLQNLQYLHLELEVC